MAQQQKQKQQKQKQKPERLFRQNNTSRPQIFVHVEFGVSWSPTHMPNPHGVTYRSRALRDRSPNFPRQIPPATTNYLAPSTQDPRRHHDHRQHHNAAHHHHYQSRSQPHAQPPQQPHSHQHEVPHQATRGPHNQQAGTHHQSQQLQPPPPMYTQEQLEYYQQVNEYINYRSIQQQHQGRSQRPEGERRPSRESRGSHERGRSAPPPINESPWDVTQHPGFPAIAFGDASQRPAPEIWKDLPETPSRFRLGEEDLPWASPWTFPMGYHPEADPEEAASAPGSVRGGREGSAEGYFGSTLMTSQAGPVVETPMYIENDPQQTRELESLQAAMMTVDNGFEAQWWNQGRRDNNVGASLGLATPPPASPVREALPSMTTVGMTPSFLHEGQRSATMPLGSVGWAIANSTHIDEDLRSHRRRDTKDTKRSRESKNSTSSGNLVSPVSDSGSSFSPSFVSPVNRGQRPHRSMSTRSEELHMGGH